MSSYPDAVNPDLVGTYPTMVESGAGYFFDEVLEFRVWCHPESGAPDEGEGADYFCAFATYEEALVFSQAASGAEEPLVLIRQNEWIDEPQPGQFIHEKRERIAEWRVEWLSDNKRYPGAIEGFISERTNG